MLFKKNKMSKKGLVQVLVWLVKQLKINFVKASEEQK